MPIIICKLTDVKLNDNKSSYPEWYDEINNLGWLTVTKFYDQKKYNEAQKITDPIDQEKAVKNARILFMLPGYVYKIEEITFTASDIHSQPITEDEAGLYVLVKVMDWSEVEVIGNPMPL